MFFRFEEIEKGLTDFPGFHAKISLRSDVRGWLAPFLRFPRILLPGQGRRYESRPDGFLDRLLDGCSRFFEPEAVAEHEGGAENLGTGVGQAFARDVGGSSSGRFVKSERKVHGVFAGSKAGGGEHAERSADHGEFVGEDVSEHVLGNQSVELVGVANQLHGRIVGVHVGKFDRIVECTDSFGHDFSPKNGGFEHARLVHRTDFTL